MAVRRLSPADSFSATLRPWLLVVGGESADDDRSARTRRWQFYALG
jgi:hypothetical protein